MKSYKEVKVMLHLHLSHTGHITKTILIRASMKAVICFFLLCSLCKIDVLGAPAEDEIMELPGLGYPIPFKHYSGYLTGSDGKQLHYWFTESAVAPSMDPVILWMNGGPGCSSLLGLFTELGPYRVDTDGKTLLENPYSWNTFANVLYLEAPACVGFSYDPVGNCTTDDDATALSNYNAVKDFFENKFPEYRENPLFITGESYAGIYVPTLTERIVEGLPEFPLNIQGFAVGNAITSWRMNDNSNIFFGNYHGLFGDKLWNELVENCCEGGVASKDTCNFHDPTDPFCLTAAYDAFSIIYGGNLNTYNLYKTCDTLTPSYSTRLNADLRGLKQTPFLNKSDEAKNRGSDVNTTPPCLDYTHLLNYLNSPELKAAAHISESAQDWDVCSDTVVYFTTYETMKGKYDYLLPRIRGLIFNGDVDMACNFLGDEWFAESLDLEVIADRSMWFDTTTFQVAGFVKKFTNLDYVTVLGAGHMVPEDKPTAALQMIQAFVNNLAY